MKTNFTSKHQQNEKNIYYTDCMCVWAFVPPPVAAPALCGHPARLSVGPSGTAPERPGNAGGKRAEWEHRHAATGRGT